ncbi:Bin3-domain-containing protein [Daedaleopsis nitida]|nr:Bin3-domain-containing protein [Daedaleopsis nitida]
MAAKIQAPVYGNYHGYYNKRPATNDQRLALVPEDLFEGKRVLDVGCNEGFVTCEIAQVLGAKRVIGVDIDDTLVRAAWKHRRSVWSHQQPMATTTLRNEDSSTSSEPDSQVDYFPASFEHMFGPLPIPDAANHQSDVADAFPHNVSFRTADWVNNAIPEDADGYDVVVAFSISKWIHLNDGDEGLLRFFQRVYTVLNPGGTFVLEPQEWDTYAKAKRMDARLKENARTLQLRPDDFERLLRDVGFGSAEHLGIAGEGGFRRPIDLYVKV